MPRLNDKAASTVTFRDLIIRLPTAAVLLAMAAAAPAAAGAGIDISVQVHQQQPWILPPGVSRIAIADPAVLDVMTLKGGHQALLIGKLPGITSLLIWIRGQREPQHLRVQVRSAVQGPANADGDSSAVVIENGQSIVVGAAPNLLDHQRAYKTAAMAMSGKPPVDAAEITMSSQVQVDVKVVEFNRSLSRQFGLNFNKSGAFQYGIISPNGPNSSSSSSSSNTDSASTGSAITSAFSLVASSMAHNWTADFNLLQSNGLARILAEPTLVAMSGQSANFLAGGEIPVPVPQGLGTTTIEYKPYGIGLTVTPTVLSAHRIALKVAPEASDLDYSDAISMNGVSVPAITTRRADTMVELGDGESFVIGGLVSHSLTSTVDKMPLLGDIPILGAFFRDLKYSRQDKELVIIVTPHLVTPIRAGVTLPLPGEREAKAHLPSWGAWLLHPAGDDQLPGFSR